MRHAVAKRSSSASCSEKHCCRSASAAERGRREQIKVQVYAGKSTFFFHELKMRTTLETADYEKLIELVRMHEFLYDASHEGHKDTQLVQSAWKSIAKEMGRRDLDGEAWKKKWKNLRDTYQKRKKEQRKYRSALGTRKKIKWRWSRVMQFLDPYLDTKSMDSANPAAVDDDAVSHKSSDKEDMDSELDRERQYSAWSAALSSYGLRSTPRNNTSVDQIIDGAQTVGYPEDAFFRSCALRAKKLPFQTRSFLQLQITQLFVNAENPELPPIPITPLPSHQHFRDIPSAAADIPLQQRAGDGQHPLIPCASDQPQTEEEGKHQANDIMNTAIAEIYN